MVSQQVTSLVKSIRSADQTVRWEGGAGHLLLETSFLRAATIDALSLWIEGHSPAHEEELKELEDDVVKLGGRVIH